MGKITFSVVITVLNEEETILVLLDTLINQSEAPGEIIIVDGGSTDKTVDLVIGKAKKSKVPIKCLIKPGFNRSEARNEGIVQAKYEYIAVTDAGCETDRDWLLHLRRGFSDQIEAVGGFYLPQADSPVQKMFSMFTCVSPEHFNSKTFLPSSRSIAFSKQAWLNVGKYPEELDTCEDLVFARNLFNRGKLVSTDKALVYWRQPKDFKTYFKQIVGYAQGDVEASYWPHVARILSVWLRYLVFMFVPILLLVYVGFVLVKFRVEIQNVSDVGVILLTQLVTDLGIMYGSVLGMMRRLGL